MIVKIGTSAVASIASVAVDRDEQVGGKGFGFAGNDIGELADFHVVAGVAGLWIRTIHIARHLQVLGFGTHLDERGVEGLALPQVGVALKETARVGQAGGPLCARTGAAIAGGVVHEGDATSGKGHRGHGAVFITPATMTCIDIEL